MAVIIAKQRKVIFFMKKLLALTLAVIMTSAIFAGCGNDDKTEETTTETTIETVDDTSLDGIDGDYEEPEYVAPVIESDNALTSAMNAGLAVGTWPSMWEVSEADVAMDFYGIDLANPDYANVMIAQCPMTFPFAEIIIIEAVDGKAAEAEKLLSDRKAAKLSEQGQYPDTVETLEASVIGTSGNYVYYVAGDVAQDVADAIIAELNK